MRHYCYASDDDREGKKVPLFHLFADIVYLFSLNDSVEFQTYALSEGLILLHVHIFKLPCSIYFLMCHTFAPFQQWIWAPAFYDMVCMDFFFMCEFSSSFKGKPECRTKFSIALSARNKKKNLYLTAKILTSLYHLLQAKCIVVMHGQVLGFQPIWLPARSPFFSGHQLYLVIQLQRYPG